MASRSFVLSNPQLSKDGVLTFVYVDIGRFCRGSSMAGSLSENQFCNR